MGKAAGVAGLALTGVLAFGIDKAAKAAMAAQTSTSRLDAAFKTAHLSAGQFAGGIDSAESSARKLGFENKDVRESLGSLVVATHNGRKAITDLGVAEDVARFKHIGLTDASKMLTMAMAGSQRAAHQLGIIVMPVTTHLDALKASHVNLKTASGHLLEAHAKLLDKMATGQAVIEETSKKLHGQADAFSQTAAGGMARFHAQVGNLEEKLGAGLLPAIGKVADALSGMADWLSKHTTFAKVLAIGLGVLAGALLAVSVATQLANLAFLASPVGAVIAGLVLLGAGIYELIKHWGAVKTAMSNLWDWVENTFLGAWHDVLGVIQTVYHWLEKNWPLVLGIITGPIGLAVVEIQQHWNAIESAVHDTFNGIKHWFEDWGGKVANWFGSLPGKFGAAIGAAIGDLESALKSLFDWHKVLKWIEDALSFHSPAPWAVKIGENIVASIAHGVGSAAGVLENAVSSLASKWFGETHARPGGVGPYGPRGPSSPGSSGSNVETGRKLASGYGWAGAEFDALNKLWTRESGWRTDARNPSSGAYGIPQSLPASKMASVGADYLTNPATQIKWGLGYIHGRYGDPEKAWQHELAYNWYGSGGVFTQPTIIGVGERGPEAVVPLGKMGGLTVNVNVGTVIGNDLAEAGRQLAEPVRRELLRVSKRNGGLGLG